MAMTKEKLAIIALSMAFVAVSLLYFQSLTTIKSMYANSKIESLESATPHIAAEPHEEPPVMNEEPISTVDPSEDVTVPAPIEDNSCYTGGCSGQLCGDASILDIATTCQWREEYACYHDTTVTRCERQADGKCGWTQTDELNSCTLNAGAELQTQPTTDQEEELQLI